MEDFVTFKIAKKLREKGFPQHWSNDYYIEENEYEDNFEVGSHYDGYFIPEHLPTVAAPTISQVLKWLREEKKIFITVNITYCYEDDENPFPTNLKMKPILKGYYYSVWDLNNLNDKNSHFKYFESPELAYLAGIEYVLYNLILII